MRTIPTILAGIAVCLSLAGCKTTSAEDVEWKDQLHKNLAVLGARNWIVIAESSFPSYAGNGVKTLVVDHSSDEVFSQVLDSLEMEGHVQPRIMVASELGKINEDYAPGIKRYRTKVAKLLPGRMHFELPNRIINGQVEDATKLFNVLVIKTTTAIPYSNIYIELDSGYWSSESETALRARLESAAQGEHKPIQPLQGANPNPLPQASPQSSPSSSSPSANPLIPAAPVAPTPDSKVTPVPAPTSSLDQLPNLPQPTPQPAAQPQPTAKHP